MNHTAKLSFVAALFASVNLFGADAPEFKAAVGDELKLAPCGAVEMKGLLGDSLNTSLKGDIMVWDIDDLVKPFKTRLETRLWQTEFWGKWYTSAELAYDFFPSPALDSRLKYGASELIKTQRPDGSISTYTKKDEFKFNETGGLGNAFGSWDLWGRKYVLLGLVNEYDRTGDKKILDAAKKHADNILDHVGPHKREIVQIGCWYGLASSSILEPMALLYRATNDKKYLDFCEWIVKSWNTNPVKPDLLNKALNGVAVVDMFEHPKPNPKNYMDSGHSKSYEMMSCYEGLTELYRITGNPLYRDAVEKVIDSIRDREITILGSGSIHERWTDGAFCQQKSNPYWMETCVTATWIKFATQLLRLTGDVKYANDIETAAYNSLIAAQKHDGSWWAHFSTMDGTRKAAPEQCHIHMNCCVASGPRGLFLLPKIAYMTSREGVVVNFYEKGGATLPLPNAKGNVDISVDGIDFVRSNTAVLTIGGLANGAQSFQLKLRIPEWSKNTLVIYNGSKLEGAKAGKYFVLDRTFKNGDEIFLNFDVKTVALHDPKNPSASYLKHGPFVLAQDKRFEPNFNKPASLKIQNGEVLGNIVSRKGANLAFQAELTDGSKRIFVDYPSAGSSWDDSSQFNVWLK